MKATLLAIILAAAMSGCDLQQTPATDVSVGTAPFSNIVGGDKWDFYKDAAGEWRWRRAAANGKIIAAATEGYKNLADCVSNAEDSGYEPTEVISPQPSAQPTPTP